MQLSREPFSVSYFHRRRQWYFARYQKDLSLFMQTSFSCVFVPEKSNWREGGLDPGQKGGVLFLAEVVEP